MAPQQQREAESAARDLPVGAMDGETATEASSSRKINGVGRAADDHIIPCGRSGGLHSKTAVAQTTYNRSQQPDLQDEGPGSKQRGEEQRSVLGMKQTSSTSIPSSRQQQQLGGSPATTPDREPPARLKAPPTGGVVAAERRRRLRPT
jgi:hypothetical protein